MKPLYFVGSSRDALVAFPVQARKAAGHELRQVQSGLMPSDFKPMHGVGPGAYEIRIHAQGEWRVIYVAKKTRQTRQGDIELASRRYRQLRSWT